MKAKFINESAFRSKRHYLLGTTLANSSEEKFEDVVYDIWPDITGDIFSKSVVQIANRVEDDEIDGYLARLNEWGGAGFSYGGGSSIFPVNRGGQMNRGGFGGANNLGGPNMMYTYEIKPLNRLLQPEATDIDLTNEVEPIHDGHVIEGMELNKKDGEIHVGTVIKTAFAENGSLKYYIIIDDMTSIKIKIDPTTAQLLSGENYVDTRNKVPGRDEADLERVGQMGESMKAKSINELLRDEQPLEMVIDQVFYILTDEYNMDDEEAEYLIQDYISAGFGVEDMDPDTLASAVLKYEADVNSWTEALVSFKENVNEDIKDLISWKDDKETSYRVYDDVIEYKGRFGWKQFPYPEVNYDAKWSGRNVYLSDGHDLTTMLAKWKGQESLGDAIGWSRTSPDESLEEMNNRLKSLFKKRFPTPKDYMDWYKKNLRIGIKAVKWTNDTHKRHKEKDEEEYEEERRIKLAKQKKETF